MMDNGIKEERKSGTVEYWLKHWTKRNKEKMKR